MFRNYRGHWTWFVYLNDGNVLLFILHNFFCVMDFSCTVLIFNFFYHLLLIYFLILISSDLLSIQLDLDDWTYPLFSDFLCALSQVSVWLENGGGCLGRIIHIMHQDFLTPFSTNSSRDDDSQRKCGFQSWAQLCL